MAEIILALDDGMRADALDLLKSGFTPAEIDTCRADAIALARKHLAREHHDRQRAAERPARAA
jgi:hypothetical protein